MDIEIKLTRSLILNIKRFYLLAHPASPSCTQSFNHKYSSPQDNAEKYVLFSNIASLKSTNNVWVSYKNPFFSVFFGYQNFISSAAVVSVLLHCVSYKLSILKYKSTPNFIFYKQVSNALSITFENCQKDYFNEQPSRFVTIKLQILTFICTEFFLVFCSLSHFFKYIRQFYSFPVNAMQLASNLKDKLALISPFEEKKGSICRQFKTILKILPKRF